MSYNSVEKKVEKNPFPSENIDPKEKATNDYGLSVARAVLARHEYNQYYGYSDRDKIQINRDYAAGDQSVDQYKPYLDAELDGHGNYSYLNIDWSIHSPAPKFVDIVLGGMINEDHKIELNAVDPKAKAEKDDARDEFYGQIMRREYAEQLEAKTGVPLEPLKKKDFETYEEADLYMDMDHKLPKEIGMEELVNFIFHHNDWPLIKNRVARDLVENNVGRVRLYYDRNNNIRLRYVDIANYISSYTDEPDYSDVTYEGELYELTVSQLAQRTELDNEQLFQIAKASVKNSGNNSRWPYGETFDPTRDYNIDDIRVQVLDYLLYTTDVHDWRYTYKNGKTYVEEKPFGYTPPERPTHEIEHVQREVEMQYSGLYVIDADILADWGKKDNIVRPMENGKLSPKTIHPYISFEPNIRRGNSKSIVERMIPILNEIQLHTLKMRHIVSEAAPPGVQIDVDGLNNIELGAEEVDPSEIIKMYKQKGVLLTNTVDEHGNPKNRPPIIDMPNGVRDSLRPHMEYIATQVNQLREITGINEARDGSEADKDSLVGIQKMRLMASNNATRELYEAFSFGIFRRVGEAIVRMVQDQIDHSEDVERYKNIIGELGYKELEISELSAAEYGMKIEALPQGEEIQRLDNYINMALQNQEIELEDAMEVRDYTNIKKARQYLTQKKRERIRQAQKAEQARRQQEAQAAQQNKMAEAKAEQLKQQAEAQKEIAVINSEYDRKEQLAKLEATLQTQHIDRKALHDEQTIEKKADLEEGDNKGKEVTGDPTRQATRKTNE